MRLVLLAIALVLVQSPPASLTLEIRVFAGTADVTDEARVTVHRAGERGQPVGQVPAIEPRVIFQVPPGLYDVQAVRERDGRVVSIRWAERLVVMAYPDERGHHLEVINLLPGYGALQVRSTSGLPETELTLFGSGKRAHPARAAAGAGYKLFVVPAGQYDIRISRGSHSTWQKGIEVPLDRTRLWIIP